jgi:hypothetical protein
LDSAILQCLQDSTQGDREADPYLALAYLGKKLDDEAARVIDDCKDLNLICRSLFFRTPKNFDASVRELEKAYNSGFGPASYFLSRIYRERNDKAKAEFWALEGHRAGVGISSLFYSLILTDSMKYQEALDILKQAKITREDLIWNPIVLKYNNVIERLSISLFFKMNQDDQVQEFLLDCANKGNPYCMGEAALQYSKQEDWSNALIWAQKGAVAGDGGSMYVLSRYYRDLNGRSAQEMNTNQFEEKISQWMMASAEAGYLPALKQVWFFYLIPSFSNRGDLTFGETAKLACYWYMKLLIAIEDEKTDPFAGAGYVSDVDFNLDDSSGRKLMDWLNCTTRFQ